MNFFGKKQEVVTQQQVPVHIPVLSNMPVGLVQKSAIPTIEKETVEWYIISTSSVRVVNGKPFYPIDALRRLKTLRALVWREIRYGSPYREFRTRQFTNGKERLYSLQWEFNAVDDSWGPVFDAYLINESTGDVTFFPKFFSEFLGRKEMQLLKIQAPEKWHTQTEEEAHRTFLDPEITLEWEPEWK